MAAICHQPLPALVTVYVPFAPRFDVAPVAKLTHTPAWFEDARVLLTTNTNPSSDGHYIANASGTTGKLIKNGSTTLYNQTILNNTTFACLSINGRTFNTIGETELKAGRKYSFAHVGEALTDTEIANLYTAIQTYHTTLGIQK